MKGGVWASFLVAKVGLWRDPVILLPRTHSMLCELTRGTSEPDIDENQGVHKTNEAGEGTLICPVKEFPMAHTKESPFYYKDSTTKSQCPPNVFKNGILFSITTSQRPTLSARVRSNPPEVTCKPTPRQ